MKLYQVTKEDFKDYVEKNNLKAQAGEWFHSTDYKNRNGEVKARCSSSSWGPQISYEIADDDYENMETIETIKNFFK